MNNKPFISYLITSHNGANQLKNLLSSIEYYMDDNDH